MYLEWCNILFPHKFNYVCLFKKENLQWILSVIGFHSVVTATGLDVGQQVSDTLGYCAKSKRVFPGLLAEATAPEIQEELVKTLVAEGVKQEKAARIVRESWFEGDTGDPDVLKSVANLKTLFEILKQNDVKVAVCTADNRRGTLNTLRNLNLTK